MVGLSYSPRFEQVSNLLWLSYNGVFVGEPADLWGEARSSGLCKTTKRFFRLCLRYQLFFGIVSAL